MKSSVFIMKSLIKLVICLVCLILLLFIMEDITNNKSSSNENISSFKLNKESISYGYSNGITNALKSSFNEINGEEVLNKAKSMTEVKWTPKYNITDKYGNFIFIKNRTYIGIPYSMDLYQVNSVEDFLSKIKDSKILYGDDCSGFVSTAWGITRQTTLTLFQALKHRSKVDGRFIENISWGDLKPGDAILTDNGKGEGHIMLYISTDIKNNNKINVYEQNVQTINPFEPLPVAREDVREKSKLIKEGYIPIRLLIPR